MSAKRLLGGPFELKHQARPKIDSKRSDPSAYSVICPECFKRFGEPSSDSWIDVIVCCGCAVKRSNKMKSWRKHDN